MGLLCKMSETPIDAISDLRDYSGVNSRLAAITPHSGLRSQH